jgi:hypothetical protein
MTFDSQFLLGLAGIVTAVTVIALFAGAFQNYRQGGG